MSIFNQLACTIDETRLFNEMVKVYAAEMVGTVWFEGPFKMVTLAVGEVNQEQTHVEMSVIVRIVNSHTFDIDSETASMDVPLVSLQLFGEGQSYTSELAHYKGLASVPDESLNKLLEA